MIYDTLEHIKQYEGLHPNLARGLRFLAETDFSKLAPGRIDIDGDDLYAMVQEYTTKRPEEVHPEAHRAYVDIQYLLAGEELMGIAPLEAMIREIEARPEGDVWFYEGETVKVPMGEGRFVVAFPGDAHAPSVAPGDPAPARKCVVKVKL